MTSNIEIERRPQLDRGLPGLEASRKEHRNANVTCDVNAGDASLQLHDSKTIVRAGLSERNGSPAMLYGINPEDNATFDLEVLRLVPYRAKHLVIKANDAAFNQALDSSLP